jgi:hypothetical protein
MTSDAPAESAPLPPKRSLGAWARVRSTFAKVRAMDGASHVVAIVAAIAFALCFGWDYGVDNQVVYLLSSLRVMDSTLLPHDWFATQTTHYHVAFRFLGGLLLALSERGWAVAITAHVSIAAGALALYALARSLCAKHAALAAYLATLLLALITRTRGAGSSYVFDHILQP